MENGTLYLIPSFLTEAGGEPVLPPAVIERVRALKEFIVETPKQARQLLHALAPDVPVDSFSMQVLDEHTREDAVEAMLDPLHEGEDVGLLSDAGCPGIADPGAMLVARAHAAGIRVVPLVGPSSIVLALMASGLNGQRFRFHGYLPAERGARENAIRRWERESALDGTTQIFIEAPFRNQQMLTSLLGILSESTRLCIATDLTGAGESVRTTSVRSWKSMPPEIDRRPTVFLLLASPGGKQRALAGAEVPRGKGARGRQREGSRFPVREGNRQRLREGGRFPARDGSRQHSREANRSHGRDGNRPEVDGNRALPPDPSLFRDIDGNRAQPVREFREVDGNRAPPADPRVFREVDGNRAPEWETNPPPDIDGNRAQPVREIRDVDGNRAPEREGNRAPREGKRPPRERRPREGVPRQRDVVPQPAAPGLRPPAAADAAGNRGPGGRSSRRRRRRSRGGGPRGPGEGSGGSAPASGVES
jgi:16S rRNA (cytidine1402-2'-O)-methyltransferase